MDQKPSFLTSTFSLLCLVAVSVYVGLCAYLRNVEALKELVMILLGGYTVQHGVKTGFRQPNHSQEEPPSTSPPIPPSATP